MSQGPHRGLPRCKLNNQWGGDAADAHSARTKGDSAGEESGSFQRLLGKNWKPQSEMTGKSPRLQSIMSRAATLSRVQAAPAGGRGSSVSHFKAASPNDPTGHTQCHTLPRGRLPASGSSLCFPATGFRPRLHGHRGLFRQVFPLLFFLSS